MAISLMTACEKETLTNVLSNGRSDEVAVRTLDFNFTANLSGENEVPPNASDATGVCIVKIAKDESSISYRLIVSNADSVTASHFHVAAEGVNGPVAAFLFGGPITGTQNGILAEGTITADDVIGPLAGDLDALINATRAGYIYVNVHTVAIPAGEVRGQVD